MYNFSEEQVKAAKGAIITYPGFGTIYLEVKRVVDGHVEGHAWQECGYYQPNMPEEYHGEYEYMNFPISCVRELD